MQILGNVAVFIPVGVLAGRLWKWKGLWVAAGLSIVIFGFLFFILIEATQYIFCLGLCEFDDLIHNMIGAAIGVGIVMVSKNKLI